MKKIFKKILRKISPKFLFHTSNELSSVNEKLNYFARAFGVYNLDYMEKSSGYFAQHGGDYFPNYIFPKSWNEKVGYYWANYYSRSPILMNLRHKWLASFC